jgi:hypothetical protein
LVVEVKAINDDRSSQFLAHLHDLELQRTGQAQTLLQITLTNQAVMSQNQSQFEKTLSDVSGVASSARKEIRLSNETISQITGGDDFGYVLYDAYYGAFTFAHEGNHTLYGVIARFVDLKKFKENPSLPTAQESVVPLGDIPPHTATHLHPIPFSDSQKQDFNVFFNARNGFWTQEVRLRLVNGKWLTATRMTQGGIDPKTKKPFELISPDFPREQCRGNRLGVAECLYTKSVSIS